jgi:hypothetical protein
LPLFEVGNLRQVRQRWISNGIGWLTIVPTYRGWGHLEQKMAERVETTIAALDEPD